MSKKTTRSSQPKPDPDTKKQCAAVASSKKVLYITESVLHNAEEDQRLRIERFYHPGKSRAVLCATLEDQQEHHIMELLEYTEPRRSWLINNEVCSNGRIYMTTPIDVTLFALHYIRKHCAQRAMSLDSIHEEHDASANRLLTKFVKPSELKFIADVKVSGDMTFYKYNAQRAIAWLALKTRLVVEALKAKQVHCGHSAQSQNYVRSDKLNEENTANETDYLRMACDIVGRYLDADLHEQLVQYLQIPSEIQALVEEKATALKRKSLQGQATANTKKIKLSIGEDASKLLDSSADDLKSPNAPTPLKERTLSAKEKALAKGAKGSKSIASFFKVK